MSEVQVPIKVENLRVRFQTKRGVVQAVNGVSFQVKAGEILGIVGESGCGKSVTSLSLMHLLPQNAVVEDGSKIFLNGQDITRLSAREWNRIRGKEIAMIFQDPLTSLNPTMTIGRQIEETIRLHEKCSRAEACKRALEMLRKVGIPAPEQRMKEYPHQLSGGMKQRVMIAIALACHPSVLIADEPTTALDVTIQAQILDLIRELKDEFKTAVILISHDMGVMASMADQILVMYFSRVMEAGPALDLFVDPKHPYTQGLLRSIPRIDQDVDHLYAIEGTVPNQYERVEGCAFAPRCPYVRPKCLEAEAEMVEIGQSKVRCWKYENENCGKGVYTDDRRSTASAES